MERNAKGEKRRRTVERREGKGGVGRKGGSGRGGGRVASWLLGEWTPLRNAVSSPAGLHGWSPSRNRIWCILALKYDVWWQQLRRFS